MHFKTSLILQTKLLIKTQTDGSCLHVQPRTKIVWGKQLRDLLHFGYFLTENKPLVLN